MIQEQWIERREQRIQGIKKIMDNVFLPSWTHEVKYNRHIDLDAERFRTRLASKETVRTLIHGRKEGRPDHRSILVIACARVVFMADNNRNRPASNLRAAHAVYFAGEEKPSEPFSTLEVPTDSEPKPIQMAMSIASQLLDWLPDDTHRQFKKNVGFRIESLECLPDNLEGHEIDRPFGKIISEIMVQLHRINLVPMIFISSFNVYNWEEADCDSRQPRIELAAKLLQTLFDLHKDGEVKKSGLYYKLFVFADQKNLMAESIFLQGEEEYEKGPPNDLVAAPEVFNSIAEMVRHSNEVQPGDDLDACWGEGSPPPPQVTSSTGSPCIQLSD